MEQLKWVFEGIGTEVVIAVIGSVFGGLGVGMIGYHIFNKNNIRQKQKAGDNANQSQIGSVTVLNRGDKSHE